MGKDKAPKLGKTDFIWCERCEVYFSKRKHEVAEEGLFDDDSVAGYKCPDCGTMFPLDEEKEPEGGEG